MDTQITQLFSYIDVNLFHFLFRIFVGFLFFSMLRELTKSIISYISFKSNKFVSIGRRVEVDSFKGQITDIGLLVIVIKNHEKVYLVQTKRWEFSNWQFDEISD